MGASLTLTRNRPQLKFMKGSKSANGPVIDRLLLDLLRAHPEGLDTRQIREALGDTGAQEHLQRRVRALRKNYILPLEKVGTRKVYILRGEIDRATDSGAISGRLRAAVLNLAKGRCQMCGKTVAEDGIKLQIDHRIPQSWGGLTVEENLWAICTPCNHGKRDHFKSFDASEMQTVLAYESVHERIAHLLKLHIGKPVASTDLEFAANATERQEDWQKRLRELRYPVIGLKIKSSHKNTPEGFRRSYYTLENWRDLPDGHTQLIRAWDNKNKRAELKKKLGLN